MSLSLMLYYCLLDQTSQLMSKTDYTQLTFFIKLKKTFEIESKTFPSFIPSQSRDFLHPEKISDQSENQSVILLRKNNRKSTFYNIK